MDSPISIFEVKGKGIHPQAWIWSNINCAWAGSRPSHVKSALRPRGHGLAAARRRGRLQQGEGHVITAHGNHHRVMNLPQTAHGHAPRMELQAPHVGDVVCYRREVRRLKAVFVPDAVYVDYRWLTRWTWSQCPMPVITELLAVLVHSFPVILNTTSEGRRGSTRRASPNIWHHWLGLCVDNGGGEQQELAGEGRICLPPILLYPVEEVNIVIDDGGKADNR